MEGHRPTFSAHTVRSGRQTMLRHGPGIPRRQTDTAQSDGRNYPPALITTNLSDDRVHPAHALKFYAKLRGISPQSGA